MHLEKREGNGKTKYFLAHSYREGKKVYKFRKYLGMNLKQSKLEERREIAEKLILEEIHKYKTLFSCFNAFYILHNKYIWFDKLNNF